MLENLKSSICASVSLQVQKLAAIMILLVGGWLTQGLGETFRLAYAPAPADNPLKGFVADPESDRAFGFPHSLNFTFLPLSDLMTGPDNYDWKRLDGFLNQTAKYGNQGIFRVYLDFPQRTNGVPQFLLDVGVKMLTTNGNAYGYSHGVAFYYPDYEAPQLRAALQNFIAALGVRYDGDPRIGFISVGLLGPWGEWELWARRGTFASPVVQAEVLAAYTNAFRRTKLVVRTPSAANAALPIGYHDDAFALHTLGDASGKFMTRLSNAGPAALEKWRTQPIGGRINPDVDRCLWDNPSCERPGQELEQCIATTHISWVRSGRAFQSNPSPARTRALLAAQKMGYELHVSQSTLELSATSLSVEVTVTNRGVAPFYYDWPVELGLVSQAGILAARWPAQDWQLPTIQPDAPAMTWRTMRATSDLVGGEYRVVMCVANPLPNGKPLRFANETQDRDLPGWLTLGLVRLK